MASPLARRGVWRQVEWLIEPKRAKEYDEARQLLIDLRDLSARQGSGDAFRTRMGELCVFGTR